MRIIHGVAIALVLGAAAAGGCVLSTEGTATTPPGADAGTETCTPGATGACYTGPEGTQDFGPCHGGTRSCTADGLWGACEGEALPAAQEDCATPEDEDCDGAGSFDAGDTDCLCQPGATVDCYTGPDGTQDVGVCRSGTAVCNPDGRSLGDCGGEVVPATAEICTNEATDDNCDGTPCGGDVLWALAAGGSGSQTVHDLAVGSDGNIVVVGEFNGELTLGDTTLTSQGIDAFVLKLSGDGQLVWAKQLGAARDQRANTVAVDPAGAIYIAGQFEDNLTIEPATLTTTGDGDFDLFVLKLSPEGNVVWAKDHGNDKNQWAGGVAATGATGVALAGRFNGRLNFGGGDLDSTSDNNDIDLYMARLDADGNHIWSYRFGDQQEQAGTGVAAGNDVYVTGLLQGTMNSGGAGLNGESRSDVFAMRRTLATGEHVWGKDFGEGSDATNQAGNDIAVDSASNVLMTGEFTLDINFGGVIGTILGTLAAPGGFLVKFNSNGGHVWSKAFGSQGGFARGRGVAADADGNVLVTGEFEGSVDLGGDDLSSSGVDVFVAKLAANGTHAWSRRFGDDAAQEGAAVAANPEGDVLVAGTFQGSMVLGNTTVTATNSGANQTLFVAKLAR